MKEMMKVTSKRPVIPAELQDDGILWMINQVVFHPRGYSLGYNPERGDFVLQGNGTERHSFGNETGDEYFTRFVALLTRANGDDA